MVGGGAPEATNESGREYPILQDPGAKASQIRAPALVPALACAQPIACHALFCAAGARPATSSRPDGGVSVMNRPPPVHDALSIAAHNPPQEALLERFSARSANNAFASQPLDTRKGLQQAPGPNLTETGARGSNGAISGAFAAVRLTPAPTGPSRSSGGVSLEPRITLTINQSLLRDHASGGSARTVETGGARPTTPGAYSAKSSSSDDSQGSGQAMINAFADPSADPPAPPPILNERLVREDAASGVVLHDNPGQPRHQPSPPPNSGTMAASSQTNSSVEVSGSAERSPPRNQSVRARSGGRGGPREVHAGIGRQTGQIMVRMPLRVYDGAAAAAVKAPQTQTTPTPEEPRVLRCSHLYCDFEASVGTAEERRYVLRIHEPSSSAHQTHYQAIGHRCEACITLIRSGEWRVGANTRTITQVMTQARSQCCFDFFSFFFRFLFIFFIFFFIFFYFFVNTVLTRMS